MSNEHPVPSRIDWTHAVIRNASNAGMAFSKTNGWTWGEDYDVFTRGEIESMEIPPDGEVWKLD